MPEHETDPIQEVLDEQARPQLKMPKYKCHKTVHAFKIRHLVAKPDGGCWLTPDEDGYAGVEVSAEYCKKHDPQPGGYFIAYDDGYRSFSPAKAFEEGYTRI